TPFSSTHLYSRCADAADTASAAVASSRVRSRAFTYVKTVDGTVVVTYTRFPGRGKSRISVLLRTSPWHGPKDRRPERRGVSRAPAAGGPRGRTAPRTGSGTTSARGDRTRIPCPPRGDRRGRSRSRCSGSVPRARPT